MPVWKPCNHDDFTGSEIITKPKVYMVLLYTRWTADVTWTQIGRPQKYTEGWSSEKMYLCFKEAFVKWRKLQVDPHESI